MEFVTGLLLGSLLTLGAIVGYQFYFRTEKKDELLADTLGKKFEEKLRLEPKEK